ncbi:MAG: hypothetical protein HYY24_19320 [Verrucomicrobia bacterium]|nr:hypothetical protein [Verrucomicrobiota bacterium]
MRSTIVTFLVASVLWLATPSASAQVVGVGGLARDFTLHDRATGASVSLYDFAGKIILIDIFAYW